MKTINTARCTSVVFLLGLSACVAAEKPATGVVKAADIPTASDAEKTSPGRVTTQPSVAKKAPADAASPAAGDFYVQLKRGACFGRCPQYTVRIDGGGRVTFNGERFVAALGEQQGQAGGAALDALLSLLRQPKVAALKDIYRPGQPGCGAVTTDMPSSEVEWQLDGRHHRLKLYGGCAAMPPEAEQLPGAVDQAAGVGMWIEQGVDR
ncbi:MAG: DUF6438 domain-containing protein [Stagnimonas sp.]|nr:DUF6438 domain-containing protein [Stagnimonas sp.]